MTEGTTMTKENPARGAAYLYAGTFAGMALGYVYWIVIARIASPMIIGTASIGLSVVAIVLSLADLGVAVGMRGFLGSTYGQNRFPLFRRYFYSGVRVLAVSTLVAFFILLTTGFVLTGVFSVPYSIVIIAAFTVLIANMDPPIQSVLISTMRTDYLAVASLAAGIGKISAGAFFVLSGFGAEGVLLGLLVSYAVSLLVDCIFSGRLVRRMVAGSLPGSERKGYSRDVLVAGMPTYVPMAIQTVGTFLGVLILYGISGAQQAGFYYVSLQIFGVVLLLPTAITSILYPYISGHQEEGPRLMNQGIRFALLLSLPLISFLIVYPALPLAIMSPEYAAGATVFQLFLASIPLITVYSGIVSFCYAINRYRLVLFVGLCTNVPRVVMYLILAPLYSDIGASASFLLGAFLGFCAAILVARRLQSVVEWKSMALLLIPPTAISVAVWWVNLNWIFALPVVMLLSYVSYARSKAVTQSELTMIGGMILPKAITDRYALHLKWLLRLIYGS